MYKSLELESEKAMSLCDYIIVIDGTAYRFSLALLCARSEFFLSSLKDKDMKLESKNYHCDKEELVNFLYSIMYNRKPRLASWKLLRLCDYFRIDFSDDEADDMVNYIIKLVKKYVIRFRLNIRDEKQKLIKLLDSELARQTVFALYIYELATNYGEEFIIGNLIIDTNNADLLLQFFINIYHQNIKIIIPAIYRKFEKDTEEISADLETYVRNIVGSYKKSKKIHPYELYEDTADYLSEKQRPDDKKVHRNMLFTLMDTSEAFKSLR